MKRAAALLAVLLLAAACTSSPPPPEPAPAPTTVAPPPASAQKGRTYFGAHWDWNRYQQFEPYLRKLAGSSTYYELSWCDIEKTQGSPDFSALDDIAAKSRALGIRLDLKIRIGVCWATGGTAQHTRGEAGKTESAMPKDLAAYQGFVTTLVKRYRPLGVTRYAIENEVNAQQYWTGTPQDYETLVRAAAQAIHGADPAAQVVDSGISSVAMGMGIADRLVEAGQPAQAVAAYDAYFARRIGTRGKQIPRVNDADDLQAALAHPVNQRNLAFLAVTGKLLTDKVVQVRQLHFYEHPDGVAPLLDLLEATTPAGVPISAWEVGRFDKSADPDPAVVADEMTRVTGALAAAGVVDVVWLPLAFNPGNRAGAEVRAGLLSPEGQERPAGVALAGLASAGRGAVASPVNQDGLAGVAFSGNGTRIVAWSDGASVPVGLPAKNLDSGAAVTEVGQDPVLVETDQPLDKALDSLSK
ncbi:hypothetical protein [Actinoplanes sp. NPDC049265]|uniref:hypothetical protein n=1 Tax=Actinoplanes sp. NPDC049265 TaxID=3363902 RepID=UPI003713AD4D